LTVIVNIEQSCVKICVMFGVHFSVLILLNMAFGNTTDYSM